MEKLITQDVSGGGVGLKVPSPFKKGARLKTLLYFPNEKKPVASLSEVVWCKKSPKTHNYYAGIRHIKIEPRDRERFVFLFCEMMVNYFLLPRRGFRQWLCVKKR